MICEYSGAGLARTMLEMLRDVETDVLELQECLLAFGLSAWCASRGFIVHEKTRHSTDEIGPLCLGPS